jgi:hypothetical protein
MRKLAVLATRQSPLGDDSRERSLRTFCFAGRNLRAKGCHEDGCKNSHRRTAPIASFKAKKWKREGIDTAAGRSHITAPRQERLGGSIARHDDSFGRDEGA